MVFLGILIDTIARRLSIPMEKLQQYYRYLLRVIEADNDNQLTAAMLASLIGKLAWFCEVLVAGRARLRRLRQCIPGGGSYHPHPKQRAYLTAAAKEDLRWWAKQLQQAVANPRYVPFWTDKPPVFANIFSDAAGDVGYGLVVNGQVYQGLWQKEALVESSGYKELVPVLLALELLPQEANGHIVVINTDNLSNVFAINKGTCHSEDLYPILFAITEIAAERQIYLIANWVPRLSNEFCDGISRYPWFIVQQ